MNQRRLPIVTALLLMLIGFSTPPLALAELRLSGIFSDHMVLQREQPATIWGWAGRGEQVTVTFAGQATVHFAHAESGLMVAIKDGLAAPAESPQTKLSHFELAAASGRWHPAKAAVITGSAVIVRKAELPKPVAVRYAYAVDPQHCHLYNRDGLPASPFCSHPELLSYAPELPVH